MPNLSQYLSQETPQTTISGVNPTPEDFGSQVAQGISAVGAGAEDVGAAMDAVDEQKAKMRAAATLTQVDLNERKALLSMQNDPQFAQKYGADGSGFANAYKSYFEGQANSVLDNAEPGQRKYLETGLYDLGKSLYGSAIEAQAKYGADFAVDTVKTAIDNAQQSANMSPDQYASIMRNATSVIDQAQNLDPTVRRRLMQQATNDIAWSAATGKLTQGGVAAAQQLLDNKMSFQVIGDDGQPQTKTIRDIVDEQTYSDMQTQATRVVKEAQANAAQMVRNHISDIKLSMAQAETPQDFLDVSKQIQDSKDSIEAMGKDGHIQYNDLLTALAEKQKKIMADIQLVDTGSKFADGSLYLNPKDADSMKAYNKWYSMQANPLIQNMPSDQRNTFLSGMLAQTKTMPELLKGDIQVAAKSMNPSVVADKADLVDRISATNPYLLDDISPKDLARLNMTSQLIGAGMTPAEAFKRVDAQVNPTSDGLVTQRKTELKNLKVDYAGQAMDNFKTSFLGMHFGGPDTPADTASQKQVQQLTTDYKTAYQTQYELTGDQNASQAYASKVIRGMYSTTNVNGYNQLMKYAPDVKLGIPNVDNGWMREQVMDAAKEALGANKTLTSPENTNPEKNVVLVPDALVTPRTFAAGMPRYKLMYKMPDGTYSDLLGPNKYFRFDPQAVRDKLVEDAKKRAQPSKPFSMENLKDSSGAIVP